MNEQMSRRDGVEEKGDRKRSKKVRSRKYRTRVGEKERTDR